MTAARGLAVRPPGPSGHRWSGNLADYERDRLGFMLSSRDDFGGIVTFDVGTTLVHDPQLAAEVLRDRTGTFDIRVDLLNRPVSAKGAAQTISGRRDVALPSAGQGTQLESRVDTIVGERFAREIGHPRARLGRPPDIDPTPVLEQAISQIIAELYFGSDWQQPSAAVRDLLDALSITFGNVLALPASWPTPARLRIRRHYQHLRTIIEDRLRQRLDHLDTPTKDPHDQEQLTVIARHAIAERGIQLADVSHAIVGALLAAYRVPAAAGAWTLLELARKPLLQDDIRAETARELPSAPQVRVQRASLTTGVILETVRLHPPTWLLRRTSSRPTSLGGYRFGAGSHFLISPYVLHRDARLYPEPTRFDPARWTHKPAAGGGRAPLFLAFGYGPHRCPGSNLAVSILRTTIQTLTTHWHIAEAPQSRVTPQPRTTLLPRGLRLELRPVQQNGRSPAPIPAAQT